MGWGLVKLQVVKLQVWVVKLWVTGVKLQVRVVKLRVESCEIAGKLQVVGCKFCWLQIWQVNFAEL